MATEEEQTVELYDFLYRDSNRLESYYAQIFQGTLSSIEKTENNKENAKRTEGLNFKVFNANREKSLEDSFSSKEVFIPHDMNTTDVLSFLTSNSYIYPNYQTAPNGAAIQV